MYFLHQFFKYIVVINAVNYFDRVDLRSKGESGEIGEEVMMFPVFLITISDSESAPRVIKNRKTELLNKCPHRRKFLARNHKT